MSGQLLASKIVVIEEEPRVRGVPSAPTSVAGAVGITERGPIDEAVLCTSFEEFQNTFGGFTQDSDLALAAMGYFENGGSQLWVVRTVHHTDISVPESATALRASGYLTSSGTPSPAVVTGTAPGPFALQDGDILALGIDGAPEENIIFNGMAASIMAGGSGPFALSDGQTLTLRIDGGYEQTIVFSNGDFVDIGNATSQEIAEAINAHISAGKAWPDLEGGPTIASDTKGLSSRIIVTGGTANTALGFPTEEALGDGNVADLLAVTIAEIASFVAGPVQVEGGVGGVLRISTDSIGAVASLQVGTGTAAAFGLDTDLHNGSDAGTVNLLRIEGKDPGAYGNRIEIEVRAATSGEPNSFDLAVVDDGVYREVFPNLGMDPNGERYVDVVINDPRTGSILVRIIDQLVGGEITPDIQTVQLNGGDDGLTGLDDNDFIGSDAGKTGLHALDQTQDLTLLLVPGRATAAVHNAMVRYCELVRDGMVFAILDPPEGQSATDIVSYVMNTAFLQELSEHAAIYWPRVEVLNPARSVFGPADRIVVPPAGIIAGVCARTDSARPGGVYDPPAGIDKGRMFGVLGFETDEVLEEAKRDLVYPKRINPLTTGPGLPRYIDGSRTLKASGNFPYVAERRGVIFIERSLKQGLQFARHKNNTEGLRAQVRRTITAFLLTQMNNGAFRSREPAKAFFVDVSEQINTPTVIFAGKLIARVGLATNKPAEFIVLSISQDTRALEAELAAAGT
jgi:phage tail sheath protein FI